MVDLLPKKYRDRHKDVDVDDSSLKAVSLSPEEKRRRKCIELYNLDVNKQKREFSHIKRLCRSLIKEGNCLSAQNFVHDRIQLKQHLAVKDINRWSEFKARRDLVVSKFIRMHKRNYVKIKIIKLVKSLQVIRIVNEKYMNLKLLVWQNQIRQIFGIRLRLGSEKRLLKQYKGLKQKLRNYLRHLFTS